LYRDYEINAQQQLRQQRKIDLEAHVEEVNRLVKQANGDIPGLSDNDDSSSDDEEEFQGFQEPEPINQEDEYIDEDKYTTVTIESVGISREGGNGRPEIKRDANGKRIWTKERPRTEWPKKKKKKFRYETKADRKVTRQKEGAKKRKMVSKQKEARATKEER
jgi:ribosomal RNA-processing protein 17